MKKYLLISGNDDYPRNVENTQVFVTLEGAQAEMRKQYNAACQTYIEQEKEYDGNDITQKDLENKFYCVCEERYANCTYGEMETLDEWWRIRDIEI